jgi:hypothetical protein
LLCRERWFAPSPAAAGARGGETRLGALADQVALEFGQRREDVEDQLVARRRGVDMLCGLVRDAEEGQAASWRV